MSYKINSQLGFIHPLAIVGIITVLGVVSFAGWRITNKNNQQSNISDTEITSEKQQADEVVVPAEETVAEQAEEAIKSSTETAIEKAPEEVVPKPADKPVATKASSNCGSQLYDGKNSEFMASNSYIATKKFKAAIAFAGLTTTIDSNKTVVFTMTDSVYDSLSSKQLEFMNKSPSNMKSVIGWHIVKSCQTYASVFKEAKSTITLQTLNGSVVYTPGGQGKVESAKIGIWDWFTSNGAVHYITDYIKPPKE